MRDRLVAVCGESRTLCRLISAWLAAAAVLLIYEGDFTTLLFGKEQSILEFAAVMVGFFAIFTIGAGVIGKRYPTDSWFLLITTGICVVFWLINGTRPGEIFVLLSGDSCLFLMAVMAVFCMILVYCLRENDGLLHRFRPPRVAILGWITFCGLIGGGITAAITCLRYRTFSAPNFDFGLFCQMFHYMKETGLPLVTAERDVLLSHFTVHLSPIYYLLLPFYAVFPSPLTLQIGQAAIVTSGLIPAYLLCRQHRLSGTATVLLCATYSFYPALSCGCFYDIHENCFLTPLLLWLFWCYEREKPLPTAVCVLLVLAVKEDAAVYLLIFAVYAWISGNRRRRALIITLCAIAYFVLALGILSRSGAKAAACFEALGETANPAIGGPMIGRYSNLIPDGTDGFAGILKTLLTNPGYCLRTVCNSADGHGYKLIYLFELLLPLGLLPVCTRRPARWMLLSPLLLNLLVNTYTGQYQYYISFQYSFGITAFLFYAAILNLAELSRSTRRDLIGCGIAMCLCLYLVTVIPTLTQYAKLYGRQESTYEMMEETLAAIPPQASVCASGEFVAHLSRRDRIYELSYHDNAGDVDYIIIDTRDDYAAWEEAYRAQGYSLHELTDEHIRILQKTAP